MLPVGSVIGKHGVSFHSYADDTQLHLSMNPDEITQVSKLEAFLIGVKVWMTNSFLTKQKVMIKGTLSSHQPTLTQVFRILVYHQSHKTDLKKLLLSPT